jgi:hypothetical protein
MSEEEALSYIPERLYKYFSPNEFTKKVISESSIYFSKPSNFNDPFDCRVNIQYGKSEEELKNNLNHYFPTLLPQLEKSNFFNGAFKSPEDQNSFLNTLVLSILDMKMGVTCFSEIPNSPLMWAHYAASHYGICLEFDMKTKSFFRDNLIPVLYFQDYPVYDLNAFKDRGLRNLLMRLMASKSEDWDYEYEWRCTSDEGGGKTYPFEKHLLKAVIFGINASEQFREEIILLVHEHGYQDVEFFQAEMSTTEYKIEFIPLEIQWE